MYIRRKVFSKVDEKLFSVKDTELIEQKEFGEVKRANKAKKKAWELKEANKLGRGIEHVTGMEMTRGDNLRAHRLKTVADTHGGAGKYIGRSGDSINLMSPAIELDASGNPKRNVNHRINTRAITKAKKGTLSKSAFARDISQDSIISDLGDADNVHVNSKRYEQMRAGGKETAAKIKNVSKPASKMGQNTGKILSKNKKIALGVGAGLAAGTAGVLAYKHYKNKDKK